MKRQIIALFALISSVVLLVGGNAFLMTLLGLRLGLEGVEPGPIGWILACYSLGFVVGTLYVDRVISRVGHIRSFAVFAAFAAVIALLHPVWGSLWGWGILRGISGFVMAGLMVVIESWFSSRATTETRGTLFAVYQICFYLAVAMGQLLVNIGHPTGFIPFSLAAILLCLALVPLSLTKIEPPRVEQIERMSLKELWDASPSGVAGAIASGMTISAFYAMGPVYGTLMGLELADISMYMAAAVVAAVLFAWPMGIICDRFKRRPVLIRLAIISSLACIGIALTEANPWLVLALTGLFMGTCAAIYPVAVAMTNDYMEAHRVVAASAGLLLSYGIGSCVGPLLASLSMSQLGPEGLFIFNGTVLVILTIGAQIRERYTESLPVEAQEHYVATLAEGTAVISELDPRNDDFVETIDPLDEIKPAA